MENKKNSRCPKGKPSKAPPSTEKPTLPRSSNAGISRSNDNQKTNASEAQTGGNMNAAAATASYNYEQFMMSLYNPSYANSMYNGYNPNGVTAASSYPMWSTSAAHWNNLLADAGQAFATPAETGSSGAALRVSGKQSAASTKKQEAKLSDTSAFDENDELKCRISEMEDELGLSTKPCLAKKAPNENVCSSNAKPNPCSSATSLAKRESGALLLSPIKDLNKHDRRWIERYDELVTYQKTHGHNMVPAAFKPLGPWVSRQRQEYKKGKLSEERKNLLDDLDFVWVASG